MKCQRTKSLRDSGGCGLRLSSVPRNFRGDCLEHAAANASVAHITNGNFTENKNHQIKETRSHARARDDCLDEQIKNSPARPVETFEVQINRYAVAHPNVIGQFITQKLPIALYHPRKHLAHSRRNVATPQHGLSTPRSVLVLRVSRDREHGFHCIVSKYFAGS